MGIWAPAATRAAPPVATSTISPSPAPTQSAHTKVAPSTQTVKNACPVSAGDFLVAQTLPSTRPSNTDPHLPQPPLQACKPGIDLPRGRLAIAFVLQGLPAHTDLCSGQQSRQDLLFFVRQGRAGGQPAHGCHRQPGDMQGPPPPLYRHLPTRLQAVQNACSPPFVRGQSACAAPSGSGMMRLTSGTAVFSPLTAESCPCHPSEIRMRSPRHSQCGRRWRIWARPGPPLRQRPEAGQ